MGKERIAPNSERSMYVLPPTLADAKDKPNVSDGRLCESTIGTDFSGSLFLTSESHGRPQIKYLVCKVMVHILSPSRQTPRLSEQTFLFIHHTFRSGSKVFFMKLSEELSIFIISRQNSILFSHCIYLCSVLFYLNAK